MMQSYKILIIGREFPEKNCITKVVYIIWKLNNFYQNALSETQATFTCSKSALETLEKVWNLFKVNNKETSNVLIVDFKQISYLFLVLLYLLWTDIFLLGTINSS